MKRQRLGLVGELTVAQILYSLVLASAMGSLLYHQLTSTLQQSFRRWISASTRDVAEGISVYVTSLDPAGILVDDQMSRLLGAEDTAYVRVLDAAGSILFERLGPAGSAPLLKTARRAPADEVLTDALPGEVLEVTVPVIALTATGGDALDPLDGWTGIQEGEEGAERNLVEKQVGTLVIGYRLDDLVQSQRRALIQAVLVGLAVLMVGVGFSVVLGRSIGGPLSKLSLRAERLARGELHRDPIPEEGRGEVRELCRAFNIMTRAIDEREEQLEHERDKLEREVEARTRELRGEALRLENANDLLTMQNARVKAADRAKSEFLATISHELRTPLNSIIGFSDLLLQEVQGPLTPPQQEDLETVHGAAGHLLDLINDLLDLSKVEAGKMEIQPEHVDLEDFLSRLRAVAQGLPIHPGVRFEIGEAGEAPAPWADPKRLHQVVLNLISNALKFTESGSVDVALAADAEGRFLLEVRDTGPGISEDHLARIFEPFGQVDQTAARQKQGTGLGLTISRQLVELMGGVLEVRSTEGEGSTFAVTIPCEAGAGDEEAGS